MFMFIRMGPFHEISLQYGIIPSKLINLAKIKHLFPTPIISSQLPTLAPKTYTWDLWWFTKSLADEFKRSPPTLSGQEMPSKICAKYSTKFCFRPTSNRAQSTHQKEDLVFQTILLISKLLFPHIYQSWLPITSGL